MEKKCPACQSNTDITQKNPYRPFCSERCRLIDLGDWLTEKNYLTGPLEPEFITEDTSSTH